MEIVQISKVKELSNKSVARRNRTSNRWTYQIIAVSIIPIFLDLDPPYKRISLTLAFFLSL